ncbi:MAG TPA: lysophospholipid acyltransferase family protein [Pyrinomonadaceae bacterium]|nr:lysophospholipid acyltransferase family protein [Pyrinomonadaceae bacterium]HMP66607.1 lysophospholipid acyltransferase family protein [Pyrinomonadaceae bacterium]
MGEANSSPGSSKQFILTELLRDRPGTPIFRFILLFVGIALKLFFRRIETVDEHLVPDDAGVIFVLNHPNGLIDPALVFVALPRRISFLAKSTLFRMPVIGWLLKVVDALPVYRRIDAGEDVSKNLRTFEAAREILGRGGSIALFPEGVSHSSSKLLPAKTGAARIALGAVSVGDGKEAAGLKIVPVGLFYTSKTTFRSEALLQFGEAFSVEPVELDPSGDPPKEAVRDLTHRIEDELRRVTLNAESEAELDVANVARSVFVSAADDRELHRRQRFLQRFVDKRATAAADAEQEKLNKKLLRFDEKLAAEGLRPEHLSLANFSQGFVVRQAIRQAWYLILLMPFTLVGAVLHAPAYQICKLLAHIYSRHGADDVASTVKVLAGMVFFPLTWLIVAAAVFYFFDWPAALLSLPALFALGYLTLVTLENAAELKGWARAVIAFLFRRERFLRRFVERGELQKELTRLGIDKK